MCLCYLSCQFTSHWGRASPLPSSRRAFRRPSSGSSRRSSPAQACFAIAIHPFCDSCHSQMLSGSEGTYLRSQERSLTLTVRVTDETLSTLNYFSSCFPISLPFQVQLNACYPSSCTFIRLYRIRNVRCTTFTN